MEKKKDVIGNWAHKYRWKILSGWIIIFSITTIWGGIQNRKRIDDIQQSRVYSCQQTYATFKKVINISAGANKINAEGQRILNRINKVIDEKNCDNQTGSDKKPTDTRG